MEKNEQPFPGEILCRVGWHGIIINDRSFLVILMFGTGSPMAE